MLLGTKKLTSVCLPRPRTSKPEAELSAPPSAAGAADSAPSSHAVTLATAACWGNSELRRRELEVLAGRPPQLPLGESKKRRRTLLGIPGGGSEKDGEIRLVGRTTGTPLAYTRMAEWLRRWT